MEINVKKEYRPSDIAKQGWILNSLGKKDYGYVSRLIRLGVLKARNYCLTGKKNYWLVKGSELKRYLASLN